MKIFRYLNVWVWLGALVVALSLAGAAYGLVSMARAPGPGGVRGTAIVNVIPAPTFTQPPPTAAPTPSVGPTGTLPPPPAPGDIHLNGYVQVSGTGGDGLRVRTEPGLSSQVVFLAIEAEVFQITDGPREIDGYTWWYLTAPAEPSKRGWAVANYLQTIQNP
jgi:hypothetical protein